MRLLAHENAAAVAADATVVAVAYERTSPTPLQLRRHTYTPDKQETVCQNRLSVLSLSLCLLSAPIRGVERLTDCHCSNSSQSAAMKLTHRYTNNS